MSDILLTGIGELTTNVTAAGDPCGTVTGAAILIRDGRIAWAGPSGEAPAAPAGRVIDVDGRAVIPGFVDSHTHLVFGGDRAEEFEARMSGRRYEAGGIRRTVAAWSDRFQPTTKPAASGHDDERARQRQMALIRLRRERAEAQRERQRQLESGELRCIGGTLLRKLPDGWENVPGERC